MEKAGAVGTGTTACWRTGGTAVARLRSRAASPAVARGTLALADQAVVSLTSFVTGAVAGHTLSREQFGLYTLGLGLLVVLVNAQVALVSTPYTLRSPRLERAARARFAGSSLVLQAALSLAGAALLVLAGAAAASGAGARAFAPVAWVLAASSAFVLLREYVRRLCFAELRMGPALVLDLAVAALQIPALLWLAASGRLSAAAAYAVAGAACAVPAAAWLLGQRGRFAPHRAEVPGDLRHHWSVGKWLFAGSIAGTLAVQVFPWILAGVRGAEAAAAFGACVGPLLLSNPFVLGATNFLGPDAAHAYAENGADGLRRAVARATRLLGLTMGAFSAVLIVFGGWIVVLLYGKQYAGHGAEVALLAAGQLAATLTLPAQYGLLVLGRPNAAFHSYLLALLVGAVPGLWLAHAYGVTGAAVAFTAGAGAGSACRQFLYRQTLAQATRGAL